jgi:HD-GYP domain-containing protein (c-di-GMP phosphodiesterase class II)
LAAIAARSIAHRLRNAVMSDAPVCRSREHRLSAPRARGPQTDPRQGPAVAEPLNRYSELTGLPFALADLGTGMLMYSRIAELCPVLPDAALREFQHLREPRVVPCPEEGLIFYGVPLPGGARGERVAAGFVPLDPRHPPTALCAEALACGWSPEEFDEWLRRQEPVPPFALSRLLSLADQQVRATASSSRALEDLDQLAGELDAAYEELTLLHEIARNLRVSLDQHEFARICLHRLHRVIGAGGAAVVLRERDDSWRSTVVGDFLVDAGTVTKLLSQLAHDDWARPVVRNGLSETQLVEQCPGVRNLVAAAILEGQTVSGWIVACNSEYRDEFGTVEASLLSSVALIVSTHLRNINLFLEQEELLVSFVRSLVSTLDAKDSYTRGHSERVALVARRLARQLNLPPRDQEAIHLSALLHDIGKIGVEDAILRKPGRLTEAEMRKLRLHPVIGDDILSGLKNLRHILPGVRHHHENFDGTGYPDGLDGEAIPLMARILAVADAYDAMGSNRPYRGGMPLSQVEKILTDGSGQQWDPAIIRAYFASRDDIRRIWETSEEPRSPVPG